jgi:hypothetical protein
MHTCTNALCARTRSHARTHTRVRTRTRTRTYHTHTHTHTHTHATQLNPTNAPPTGGGERFEFFKRVVSVPDARKTTLAWSFDAFHTTELWVALVTFLYLDFLDATGEWWSGGGGWVAGSVAGLTATYPWVSWWPGGWVVALWFGGHACGGACSQLTGLVGLGGRGWGDAGRVEGAALNPATAKVRKPSVGDGAVHQPCGV